jgi:flagella basal body P-ring formation protein FlgA
MTTTEFNRPKSFAASQPSDMGAGADIFRRMDRRQNKFKWTAAVPIVVLTACSVGGVLAYVMLTRPSPAPQPAPALVAAAPVAAQPAAPVAPPPVPAKATHPHASLSVVHSRPSRHAASSKRAARTASVGEEVNTSASVPAASATTPPSPPVAAPSVPVITAPPAQAAPAPQPATPPQ